MRFKENVLIIPQYFALFTYSSVCLISTILLLPYMYHSQPSSSHFLSRCLSFNLYNNVFLFKLESVSYYSFLPISRISFQRKRRLLVFTLFTLSLSHTLKIEMILTLRPFHMTFWYWLKMLHNMILLFRILSSFTRKVPSQTRPVTKWKNVLSLVSEHIFQ